MRTSFSRTSQQVFHNTKIKYYGDGSYKSTCASAPVYKDLGWEAPAREFIPKPKDMTNETRSDSITRARNCFEDIGRNNDFTLFFTLTFDPAKVDSFDVNEVKRYVKAFFSNLVQRNNANYIAIGEHHKSGRIHLHGFMNGDIKLVDSGKVRIMGHKRPISKETAIRCKIPESEWHTVYNMPQWKYGFSTVIKFDTDKDKARLSGYMRKYVTKDFQMIFGNFYLAGGKNLVRKPQVDICDLDYNQLAEGDYHYKYCCETTGTEFKVFDSYYYKPEVDDDFCEMVYGLS